MIFLPLPYAFPSVFPPASHSTGQSSPVCNARSARIVSFTDRPTDPLDTMSQRTIPCESMINVPRWDEPSESKTLYMREISCVVSARIGYFTSGKSRKNQFLCDHSLSVEHARIAQLHASNSFSS